LTLFNRIDLRGNKGLDESLQVRVGGPGKEEEVYEFLQQFYEGELRRRVLAATWTWLKVALRLGIGKDVAKMVSEFLLASKEEEGLWEDCEGVE